MAMYHYIFKFILHTRSSKLFIVTTEFQFYAITYQKWTLTMAFFVERVQECNRLDGLAKTHLI
jgi:hypothetical protein